MSRAKRRKSQKQKGQKQSNWLLRGGAAVVAIVIVGLIILQLNTEREVVLTEDGRPTWQTIELRDARTGETFTLADFDNQDVVVKITSLF
ncbi:MAG: hypothetical protein Q9P44_21960 [Anaerolineae bacterium]|nr:hypothetical protein [Anaerolineae bacterium]